MGTFPNRVSLLTHALVPHTNLVNLHRALSYLWWASVFVNPWSTEVDHSNHTRVFLILFTLCLV